MHWTSLRQNVVSFTVGTNAMKKKYQRKTSMGARCKFFFLNENNVETEQLSKLWKITQRMQRCISPSFQGERYICLGYVLGSFLSEDAYVKFKNMIFFLSTHSSQIYLLYFTVYVSKASIPKMLFFVRFRWQTKEEKNLVRG